jgi:glycine/D-amino acid oxidase-like deaminating enzyme
LARAVYAGDLHFRPHGTRLLVGRKETLAHRKVPTPVEIAAASRQLLADVTRWIPGLGETDIEAARVGCRPMPPDGLPIVGWLPGHDRIYVAVGHGGITIGPLVGRLVADEIISDRDLKVLKPFRPSRFVAAGRTAGGRPQPSRDGLHV